jgi:hypothetical protein
VLVQRFFTAPVLAVAAIIFALMMLMFRPDDHFDCLDPLLKPRRNDVKVTSGQSRLRHCLRVADVGGSIDRKGEGDFMSELQRCYAELSQHSWSAKKTNKSDQSSA